MKRHSHIFAVALVLSAAASASVFAQTAAYTSVFQAPREELASSGRNTYFILEPGYRITLEDGRDRLEITVLNETRRVDGVDTRIVEEREWEDGELLEVSRNFFAISRRTNAVYYFGEEVDMYKKGKVTSHEGAWLAGVNGARFGMIMPGDPLVGARYYQEIAPGIAMDRAEIVDVNGTMTMPVGRLTRVLQTKEGSDLEKGVEPKFYAPGIGLIQEGSLKVVKHGPVTATPRR